MTSQYEITGRISEFNFLHEVRHVVSYPKPYGNRTIERWEQNPFSEHNLSSQVAVNGEGLQSLIALSCYLCERSRITLAF